MILLLARKQKRLGRLCYTIIVFLSLYKGVLTMEVKTVDDYIWQFSSEKQQLLQKIRETIQAALPEAEERISYDMPLFWQLESLIWFAGMKDHIGIYPTNSGISAFAQELKAYKPSKGAFQIPWDEDVPYTLIADIARFRLTEVKKNKGIT